MKSLLYIALFLVFYSCTYSNTFSSKELDEAELLMQTDPQAALGKLNRYDVSEFEDSATLARWALLYSEAMVANRLAAPRDTIVNIAIDWYGRHGFSNELAKAQTLKRRLGDFGRPDALSTALYVQKEKEFQLYTERMRRERYVLFGVMALLVAAGVIVWQRQRMKLIAVRHEALIAEASTLRDGLTQKQTAMTGVLARRFSVIDELCGTYYESSGTKAEQKNVAEKVKSQIEAIRQDEAVFAGIESDVNACRRGVAAAVKPALKAEEYRLFVWLACGLSNRSIALLIGESIGVVYKRKSRLKAKITAMELPEKAFVMEVF